MTQDSAFDAWNAGQSYDHYMGRWSRRIAKGFLEWLQPPPDMNWLEIGCGTGALTQAILKHCAPRSVMATDRSPDFVEHARKANADPRIAFGVSDAQALPAPDNGVDAVTSALVLNFIPDRIAALREMRRVLKPGGTLSFYVWDYPGGGMGFIDAFWKAASALDPAAAELDEGMRFPFCSVDGLSHLCQAADIPQPEIKAIEVETEFADFDAFWHPFTLGAGPAPGYCQSLEEKRRDRLRETLKAAVGSAGPIRFPARAWAVKSVPG